MRFDSEVEQAETGLDNLAKLSAAFLASLLQHGFTREEAIEMVMQWQASIWEKFTKGGN